MFWLRQECRRSSRCLSVDPDTFDVAIASKTVTNGADKDLLKVKYRKTFLSVVVPATAFELANMPQQKVEAWTNFFDRTLTMCCTLVKVDVSRNEAIITTLKTFSSLLVLEELDLTACSGIGGSLDSLAGLVKLRKLMLAGCVQLQGKLLPLSGLTCLAEVDLECCMALQGTLEPVWDLRSLTWLNVCDTGAISLVGSYFIGSHIIFSIFCC